MMDFTEDFLKNASIKHNNIYDYSLMEYINMRTNIKIICKKHGVFEQRPDVHLSNGCKYCFIIEKGIKTFLEKVIIIHNNIYEYDLSTYINRSTKINIICKKHGVFLQTPHQHLSGKGCPKCKGGVLYHLEDFIKLSNNIHNYKYNYNLSVYVNSYTKVKIICKEHGIFSQKPNNHLNGKGCPKCIKKFGIKENKWLDSLNIKDRQVRIEEYIVDGYDPITNTVYEFNGDFWHGNPYRYNPDDINNVLNKTFGELYKKTLKREKYLVNKGYNIISIWESDFDKLFI